MQAKRIEDLTTHIEKSLLALRTNPLSDNSGSNILAPSGYLPVVALKSKGRKIRRDASFDYWSPESGEISISFVRDTRASETGLRPTLSPASPAISNAPAPADVSKGSAPRLTDPEEELCDALAEVERQGRAFIALKWFRDDILPGKGFAWAARLDDRQAVLARAIKSGLVSTSKIANPRSPAFPTSTLRLNRNRADVQAEHRRYAPTRIRGEALSETILQDRGVR